MSNETKGPQPPAEAQAVEGFKAWVVGHFRATGQPSERVERLINLIGGMEGRTAAPQPPAEAQAQGGGEALEAELIALVAGPYHYHHKMDEHAEREGKAFDRCRELTIQNIRTWCATRRAMLAAQPPSAPVGVEDADLVTRLDAIHQRVFGKPYPTEAIAQQPAAVDRAVGTVTRVGSFEVQEHRIELDPGFDERLNHMPEGTVVRLYAAPMRDLTQQQLAVASAALAAQQGDDSNE